jgi:Tfp pilus assembly protein PilX
MPRTHAALPARLRHHLRHRLHGGKAQRGVATLLVVMALFFLVSMVAAYTSRNLVFEQRTSANQYRATQAFETAEGGIEWTLALLNGARVDATCSNTVDPASAPFRTRYLAIDAERGTVSPVRWNSAAGLVPLNPSCIRSAGGWACSCPADAAPAVVDPGGAGVRPVFRVQFEGTSTPGVFRIVSTACTANDDACLRLARGEGAEAAARLNVTVALAPALLSPPTAAITLRGSLDVGAFPLQVINADAGAGGITIRAGAGINAPAAVLSSAPGTPPEMSLIASDASLAGLTADRMFSTFFGVSRNAFARQPATLSFTCGGGCGDRLRQLVADNPGRPVWVTDALTIDSNVQIGSAVSPALLVAAGGVDMTAAGASIVGVVYSQAASWASNGTGSIQGALVAEGNLAGASAAQVRYDAAVVNRVRLTMGSVIRVPGGWRDF